MLSNHAIVPALPAGDIDRAEAFYRDVLGFEPVEVSELTGEVTYESGGAIFIVYASAGAGTNQATAAAWRVPDLRAVVSALRERGVVFEEYDFETLKTVDSIAVMPDGTQVAWFKDSEGNILGIDQLPSSMTES